MSKLNEQEQAGWDAAVDELIEDLRYTPGGAAGFAIDVIESQAAALKRVRAELARLREAHVLRGAEKGWAVLGQALDQLERALEGE